MNSTIHRLATVAVGAGFAALAVAGCSASVSVGTSEISQSTLEQTTADKLEEQIGQRPDEVQCAGGLKAEVGATQDCALRAGEDWLTVDINVTGVQDDVAEFDINVGKTLLPESPLTS